MAVTKKGFQRIAKKLIGGIFKDFLETTPIYNVTGYDYATESEVKEYQTPEISFIRIDYESHQIDGQQIKVNDFMLIAENQLLSIAIEVDKSTVVYKGELYEVKRVNIDTADASITLQVRRK